MRLVIQGQTILPEQVDALARLTGCTPQRIAEHAFVFKPDQVKPEVLAYCEAQQLDCGYIQEDLNLNNIRLVVMDMDSTLISIECIDEVADMSGLKTQVSEITESAMRGEIEFAESLRRRVALLEGLDEQALHRAYDERLRLNPGAQFMLKELKVHGIKTLLVSGGFTFFTDRLKAELGLDYAIANTLEIKNGKLTGKVLGDIIDAQAKADALDRVRTELGLERSEVVAIGDGANDLKMLAAAGIGIAYHAKPIVRQQAGFAINHAGLDGVINLLRNA